MARFNLLRFSQKDLRPVLSGILAHFDQKSERLPKAIYGMRTFEIRIDLYLGGAFKTVQVLEDLAKEPLERIPENILN